jgi:hypothetical protein
MGVSIEDSVAITDLIARYCYHVDAGHADEWADLWTEDGVMDGMGRALTGREQLRKLPASASKASGGTIRHQITNLVLDYGDSRDEVRMRASGLMTSWEHGGKFLSFANYDSLLVRVGGDWKLKTIVVKIMNGVPQA